MAHETTRERGPEVVSAFANSPCTLQPIALGFAQRPRLAFQQRHSMAGSSPVGVSVRFSVFLNK